MRRSISLLFVICLLGSFTSRAQQSEFNSNKGKLHGTFFFNWGYHGDAYTKSTIEFKDNETPNMPHYDFTLHNAKAHDKPDLDDFFHTPLTVPQYVVSAGYFFNDKRDLGIEVCWNHLKYVVTDNQVMHMTGTIDGQYYDVDTLVTPGFVHFEHTNGNNYLIVSLLKRVQLLSSKNKQNILSANFRVGPGLLVPKSDSYVTIQNQLYHNDGPFRVSGWVVGVGAALHYDFFKYFFLEPAMKGSYADYTSVKLYEKGRANHRFFSIQYILSMGINIPLFNKLVP